MRRPLFAFALDALPPGLVEDWIRDGVTPRLGAWKSRGAYGHLSKSAEHPHETSWSAFLQGCQPDSSGEWGRHVYHADQYRVEDRPTYALAAAPPFYAHLREGGAVLFDVPHAGVLPSLGGLQCLGWGVEENLFRASSQPRELYGELVRRHGPHPFFGGAAARVLGEDAEGTRSTFRLPSFYDPAVQAELQAQIGEGIRRREAILLDLLGRGPWRFALAVSAELHLATHMLWHRPDALAELASQFDASLGRILDALPADADIALFSVSGMAANHTDLPTSLFLPELLYRLQFGEAALAAGDTTLPPPPPAQHYRRHWREEVWDLRTAAGERDLESPVEQERRGDPFDWCPLNWYAPLWPRMRAFALPSFSHGMVRLNLRGRDPKGLVAAEDYERTCGELTEAIRGLVNARSGRPLALGVHRTRQRTLDDDPRLPPVDLVVTWDPAEATDVADSPRVGRIGPAPWLRPGGHIPDGFCILAGPEIEAGGALPARAGPADLTATLVALLGLEPPANLEGRSLLPASSVPSRNGRFSP